MANAFLQLNVFGRRPRVLVWLLLAMDRVVALSLLATSPRAMCKYPIQLVLSRSTRLTL